MLIKISAVEQTDKGEGASSTNCSKTDIECLLQTKDPSFLQPIKSLVVYLRAILP
jgi:hypothetical protein